MIGKFVFCGGVLSIKLMPDNQAEETLLGIFESQRDKTTRFDNCPQIVLQGMVRTAQSDAVKELEISFGDYSSRANSTPAHMEDNND